MCYIYLKQKCVFFFFCGEWCRGLILYALKNTNDTTAFIPDEKKY